MRERVAVWLHRVGALRTLMQMRRYAPAPMLSIVTYHHIAEPEPSYPYDPDVADATPAQFRRQMETLARYGSPIGIDDLIAAIGGAPLPKNPVMVTFDDGYRSCHDVALPILRAVGIRATFFIATSFISERRLYWWERISVLLGQARRLSCRTVTLTYPHPMVLDLEDPRITYKLNRVVKDTQDLDVERYLEDLARALGVAWSRQTEADYADGLIMTWDHVRALARAGMDVESHGRCHRVLQTLDAGTLDSELAGSRRDLEEQLGRPVRAIAYPVGHRINNRQHIRDALAAAGYQIGMSNQSGVNRWLPPSLRGLAPIDRFDVRRLATDREISDAMFLTQVALPQLAYMSKQHR